MRRIFIFFILGVVLLSLVSASDGTEDAANWNKTFDGESGTDEAYSVAIDSNNNVYVVGYGQYLVSGSSGYDWWIKKFSASGVEDTANWNKTFSGTTTGYDIAYSVAVDGNNNVYVVGYGQYLVSGSNSYDWWIKKFSSSGVEDTANWNKTFSSAVNYGDDEAYSVAVDSNNNIYVVGRYYGASGAGDYNWWIKKFSSSGVEDTANWNKTFSSGINTDEAYSVAVDSNDNVYVAGYGQDLVSGSNEDWWIKKFSSSGVEDTANWNKTFGVDGIANSVAIDSNNNVYVAGYGRYLVSGTSNYDWLIKKFSSSGVEDSANWNKTFDGGAGAIAYSVAIDGNDSVYVVGKGYWSSYDDWWIKKFSSSGVEDSANWNKTFDGGAGAIAYSVAIDGNDSVYVAGYGKNLVSGSSGNDWWIKKFISAVTTDVPEFGVLTFVLAFLFGLLTVNIIRRRK